MGFKYIGTGTIKEDPEDKDYYLIEIEQDEEEAKKYKKEFNKNKISLAINNPDD